MGVQAIPLNQTADTYFGLPWRMWAPLMRMLDTYTPWHTEQTISIENTYGEFIVPENTCTYIATTLQQLLDDGTLQQYVDTQDYLTLETVQEYIDFLNNCGGYEYDI